MSDPTGTATNGLSKMFAGLGLPERLIGNMCFAAWSHSVISNAVSLSNDLKMGEYRECLHPASPCGREVTLMYQSKFHHERCFLTQIYGTILGGFVNYAVMISIVRNNRELLVDSDGSTSWSGAAIQSYNTNAASWALSKYLYRIGSKYELVSPGLLIGAGAVGFHRVIVHVCGLLALFALIPLIKKQVRSPDPRVQS